MAILVDKKTRVLVQGITGREGRARAKLMKGYGTNVVAGVTPGKGGMEVEGVPVFDSVYEAIETVGEIDASAVFVPAPFVKAAALEAIDAGVKLLLLVPDRVPIHDTLEIASHADRKRAKFVGPNTLGVLSPGKAVLGMIGGRPETAKKWFNIGDIGVSSRSGGITSAISYYISRAGFGLSTIVHVGGDVVVGLPHPEIMKLFEKDADTKMVVMFGEIGTTQEERVAEMMKKGELTKPLVAFIGGKAAKEGTRFSHAGAIVEGGRGSYASKVRTLKEAGAYIAESLMEIPKIVAEVRKEHKF